MFTFLVFVNICSSSYGQQCLGGGCSNNVSQYPTTTLTPTTSWQTQGFMNGGNWTLFNVVCGNTYEWTYCEAYGGVSTAWDAQLTLDFNPLTGTHQCFSDNVCGTNGNAPYLRWTSPVTGTVRILTSQSNCLSNSGSPWNTLAYRQAVTCTGWAASPTTNSNTSYSGFSGAFTVTTSAAGPCYFSASTNASWITGLSGVDGTPSATQLYNQQTGSPEINTGSTGGYAQVNYTAQPNTTCSSRTGYIYLYDLCNNQLAATYTVTQAAAPPVTPAVSISANSSTTICSGQTVTFTPNPTNGGNSPSYAWYLNGSNVSNSYSYTTSALTSNATVYCIMTSNATCASPTTATSSTIIITVNPTPNTPSPSASPNPVCAGQQLTLNSGISGSYTYNWSGPNGFTSSQQNPVISNIQTSGGGQYSLTVTEGNCSSQPGSVTITVNPLPTNVNASAGTNPICQGLTLNLNSSATNAISYVWSGPNGYNSSTQNAIINNMQSAEAGTYTLTAGNSCGSVTAVVNVSVTSIPSNPIASASPNPICQGQSLNLSSSATGATAYSWSGPNGYSSSSQNPTISNIQSAQNGTYTITSSNSCGSVSASVSVTVNPLPSNVTASASPNPICQGNTLDLSGNSTNGTTYLWSGPGGYTSSQQNPTEVDIQPIHAGTYTLSVGNSCGSVTASVSVIVNALPANVTASSNPNPVCQGSTVNLTSSATNGTTYSWSGPDGYTSSQQNTSITNIQSVQGGNYTLTVGNSCGSVTATANVSVTLPQQVGLSITTPTTTVCLGSTVTFSTNPINGGVSPSYEWNVNGSNVANGSSYTINSIQNNTTVFCSMTSSLTCITGSPATSNTLNIAVVTQATATVNITDSPSVSVCAGTPVTFTASAGNGGTAPLYHWLKNGQFVSSNSTVNTFTTSALNNSDVISCIMTSNSNCVTTDTAASNQIVVSVIPTVTPTIVIAASPAGSICAGVPVTFNATSSNAGNTPTYQWKLNGNNVGINSNSYFTDTLHNGDVVNCVLISSANCTSSNSVTSNSIIETVNHIVSPSVSITANPNGSVCIGSSIAFTATVTNGGNTPSYQWVLNGGTNVGTDSSVYTTSSLQNGDVISCVLTSNANCANPVLVTSNNVTVNETSAVQPTVSIADSPNTSVCAGTMIAFTASINGGGSPTYYWKVNGIQVGSNPNYSSSTLTANDTVTCTIQSSLTCASPRIVTSNPITLNIYPSPGNTITPCCAITVCAGDSVRLTGPAGDPLYQWSTGATSPYIYVKYTGSYSVTATSANACTAASSPDVTVTVDAPLPPTIVPSLNGDTLNSSPATTYQWYFNNNAISGATNQTLIPTQNGLYHVEVSDSSGCKSSSQVFTVTTVGINEIPSVLNLSIMPNPSHGRFIIGFTTTVSEDIHIEVFDPLGRVIYTESLPKISGVYSKELNIESAAQGLYILRLISGDRVANNKIEIN